MRRWQRAPAVLWRSTSRGPVVLAPGSDEAELLGGLGAIVWELLDSPLDDDALVDGVASVAGAAAPSQDAIDEALSALHDRGLVELEDGGSP